MYTPRIIDAAPELSPQTLRVIRPATIMVVRSQLERGEDTPYDHFMWDHVGDPYDQSRQPIKIKSRPDGTFGEYDKRLYAGFSDRGRLFLVKKDSLSESAAEYQNGRIVDDPNRYYFVMASLQASDWQYDGTWRDYYPVIRAEHLQPPRSRPGDFSTELFLGDGNPAVLNRPEAIVELPGLTGKLAQTALAAEIEDYWASRPRLSLDSQQVAYSEPGKAPEHLRPITELVGQLAQYGASIAKALVGERAEAELLPVTARPEAA